MEIPEFIKELVENNITVRLTKDGFEIEGFYKSGKVEVKYNIGNGWEAFDRYNEVTRIRDVVDIVCLNYDWWRVSKDRYEGWNQPDSVWIPLLEKYGFIEAEIIPEKKVWK